MKTYRGVPNLRLALPIAAAWLVTFSPATAGFAGYGDHQRPRFIGSITGDPEKDTFGCVVSVLKPQSVAPVIWSDGAGCVGRRTGYPEGDTFERAVLHARTAAGKPVGYLSHPGWQTLGLFASA
jgi:hypothetical protein